MRQFTYQPDNQFYRSPRAFGGGSLIILTFVGVPAVAYAWGGDLRSAGLLLLGAVGVIGVMRWLLAKDRRYDATLVDTWLELSGDWLTQHSPAGIVGEINVQIPLTLECPYEGLTMLVFEVTQGDQRILFSSDHADCRELVEQILGGGVGRRGRLDNEAGAIRCT